LAEALASLIQENQGQYADYDFCVFMLFLVYKGKQPVSHGILLFYYLPFYTIWAHYTTVLTQALPF
jgi:hypothetical protein